MKRRLGWLGPALVAVAAAIAAVFAWFMLGARPEPGPVIDELALGDRGRLVIRAEDGGIRSFAELYEGDELKWRALVPTYAGRPGATAVAWNDHVISIRVIRDGVPEIFALRRDDASKVGGVRLAKTRGPATTATTGPVTVHDGKRSYELIAGDGWQVIVAVDLQIGRTIWERELSTTPIGEAGVERGLVWVEQAGHKRFFDVFTGKENRSVELVGPPPDDGVPPPWPTPAPAPASPAP